MRRDPATGARPGRRARCKRRTGARAHVVNYHHVIHSLRAKPQALANLIYREGLFPRTAYRRCWEALAAHRVPPMLGGAGGRQAPRRRLPPHGIGLLWLAHDEACEADLASALAATLPTIGDEGALPDLKALTARFQRPAPEQQDVRVTMPAAASYDALIAARGAAA